MPKFKPYDYNQSAMIVINYKDQLQDNLCVTVHVQRQMKM